MLVHTTVDQHFWNQFGTLWLNQYRKHYPQAQLHCATVNMDTHTQQHMNDLGIQTTPVGNNLSRAHIYLSRWLYIPESTTPVLVTQINVLPIKTYSFANITAQQTRVCRQKPGKLGGVGAQLFEPDAAQHTREHAASLWADPPEYDHDINVWMMQNLTQDLRHLELRIKKPTHNFPDWAHWISAPHTNTKWPAERKAQVLKAACG